jgi:hypothetical protein
MTVEEYKDMLAYINAGAVALYERNKRDTPYMPSNLISNISRSLSQDEAEKFFTACRQHS